MATVTSSLTVADSPDLAGVQADVADLRRAVRLAIARVEAQAGTLADLGARLAVLEVRHVTLTAEDRRRLARLLPVVAGEFGSDVFTVKQARARACDHAGLRLVLADITSDALGKLLSRACGHAIAGFVVRRVGTEGHAGIWRVEAVVVED